MNIQDDLFDSIQGVSKEMRAKMEKLKLLATGKHLRGIEGKKMWEAHVNKMEELFGKSPSND